MRRVFYILLLSFIFSTAFKLKAQDRTSDSLALVDFYNQCGGTLWTNHTGWLTGPLDSWHGVVLVSERVDMLNLSSNNLTGSFPISFCDLTALRYLFLENNDMGGNLPACFGNMTMLNSLFFTNNKFTGSIPPNIVNFPHFADLWIDGNDFTDLPDMSSMPELSTLKIRNNKFTFEDIFPNVLRAAYSPQDSLDQKIDTLVDLRDTLFLFVSPAFGTDYQWYKDGVLLSDNLHFNGTTTATLKINYCTFVDTGNYTCVVEHSSVPFLDLVRNQIAVIINDNRLPQQLDFTPGIPNVCGNKPVRILAVNEANLPFETAFVSGPGKLSGDTLIPFTQGTFVLNYSNDGDDYFLPLNKDTTIVVLQPAIPSVKIEEEIPIDFGEKFYVEAIADSARFSWITPLGDTLVGNDYSIERTFKEHEGVYKVIGYRNSCFYFESQVLLQFEKKVKPFQLLTPNGDGKNDVLIIEGILDFPENKITVFNAWQQVVYSQDHYSNDWSGDGLPEGTYYLQLELKETRQTIQTSFVLRK